MSKLIVNEITKYDASQVTFTDNTNVVITGSLSTAGASVGGTLAVSGAATLSSTLGVTGVTTMSNNLNVTGVVSTVGSANGFKAGQYAVLGGSGGDYGSVGYNVGYTTTTTTYNYLLNDFSSLLRFDSGGFKFLNSSSGTAGAAITLTERMHIKNDGDISFRDSSANEAFYWDASAASLGIGITPNTKLHVAGNLTIENSSNTPYIDFVESGDNTDSKARIAMDQSDTNNGVLIFSTEGSGTLAERMRIDSGGSISVGGFSPSGTPAADYRSLEIGRQGNSIIGSPFKSSLYLTSNATITEGSSTYTYRNTGSPANALYLEAGELKFFNAASGTAGDTISFTERMRITSGGYLKASNDGTYYASAGVGHELRSSDTDNSLAIFSHTGASPYGIFMPFTNDPNNTTNTFFIASGAGTNRFIVYSNGNVVNTNNSYGAISDAKLKENVTDASPKLEDLMQVKVRNFNYIGDDKKQLGVVAQELEQVFPSMIDESPDYEEVEVPQLDENGQEVLDENGEVVMTKERVDLGTVTKSVKYSVFVPMLIKAIQELNAKVESLEAQLNA